MDISMKDKRPSKKKTVLTETAMTGLKLFSQGALTGLGMRVGAGLYDRFNSKTQRARVESLRRQG